MGSSSVGLSVRLFGVVFCVPSFPGASSCVLLSALFRALSGRSILLAPYRRRFCLALLCRASFPRLLSQSFFGTLFCRAFPMGYSPVHLPCKLPHGRFPWTLSRVRLQCALSGVDFWFNFLPGLFPCNFLPGRLQWEHLRGLFVRSFARVSSVRFFAGTFYPHSLVGSFFVLFFVCAFPLDLFAQLLPCSLSWGSFPWHSFAVEISIGSYPGAFPVRFFAVAFSARSFAEVFAARFFAGGFFTTAFRKLLPHSPLQGFSRGLLLLCSLLHGRFPIIVRRVVFSALS